jgi:F0F1-type ATP synthase assembly protein I
MAIQFFVLVGIGAWLGQKLDKLLSTSKPYFTIGLILLFSTGFFYTLIRDLNRKDES